MENSTVPVTVLKNVFAQKMSFSWYDYGLFSTMLGLSAAIGIYYGCFGTKQSTAGEYLLGDKKMSVFPISISLVASHVSGITLLAVPAEVYRYGTSYWLIVPSMAIVGLSTIYIYLPVFYKLQITSTYEYLERRYDSRNRLLASFLFTLSLFLYLPVVIYIPALAFSAVTGINVHLITPVVCGVCIFYTTLGGIKSVVWTDTLQFSVTIGAVFAVFVLGIKSAGGFGAVWESASKGDRLNVFDFDLDPTKRDSFWISIIGLSIGWLSATAMSQTCVQKFLSLPSLRQAKMSVVYFVLGIMAINTFSIFTGLIMYSKYSDCDPFTTGLVSKNDQLLPFYIMDVASKIPGLSGLFIAGIFCAALSTLSASLNSLAGTIYEDFVVRFSKKQISQKTASNILKLIVVIIGVICTLIVFVIEKLGGVFQVANSLGGCTSGPMVAMFTLGMLCPRISSRGSFYGTIFGLVFCCWMILTTQYYIAQGLVGFAPKPTSVQSCGVNETFTHAFNLTNTAPPTTPKFNVPDADNKPFILFRVSFFYYTPIGMIVTMFLSAIFSYLLKNNDPPLDKDLLCPLIHRYVADETNKKHENGGADYYQVDVALDIMNKMDSDKNKDNKSEH